MLLDRSPQQLVEGGVEAQGRTREALAPSAYVTQSQTAVGPTNVRGPPPTAVREPYGPAAVSATGVSGTGEAVAAIP